MEYRPLGESEIDLSEVGFGCGDNAGLMMSGTAEERSAAIARALELGINYFDTAAHYGDTLSETNLGLALQDLKARPIIATKVRLLESELADIPGAITRSLEGSLSRLQVAGVDILYLHNRIGPERVIGSNGGVQRVSVEDVTGPGGVLETFNPGVSSVPLISLSGRCSTLKLPNSWVRANLLRVSRSLGLAAGVSTVRQIALKPASSARCTSISVRS